MATIKARLHGGDRQGKIREFEIVDELPEIGESASYKEPEYIYSEIFEASLDPEQGIWDDREHYKFDFYIAEITNSDDPDDDPDYEFYAVEIE